MTEPTTYTEAGIAHVLVHAFGMFPPRKFLAVENVSWGLDLPWEADLIVMNRNGFLQEVEIKISLADLKRDQAKRKHIFRRGDTESGYNTIYATMMKRFWYAMPETIWQMAAEKLVPIPPDAGVIIIKPNPDSRPGIKRKFVSEIAVQAKTNVLAKPLGMNKRYKLARLGVLRYWDRVAA